MNDSFNPNRIGDDSVPSTRMTTQSSPPSLAPKTAQRTSLGRRLQRALTGGPNRRFPGLHSPLGGTASTSLLANRGLSFPIVALLAALAVGLLFLLPGGPLHAQDADDTIEYAENGTGMVATYNAVDPEGTAIEWDVSGADADLFGIEGGVLTFKESPNFEDEKDKVGTDTGTDTSTPDATALDNVYEVMVEATDANGQVGKKHVKVEVTNVDEAGTVKLSALQPAPGVAFTATLTDIDSSSMDLTDSATWQWAKSQSNSGGWADIDKATGSTYTPDVDGKDSGYYLRATAKYTDGQSPGGAEEDKTAYMVSANKVLVLRVSNEAPEFAADQDPDADGPQAEAPRKVAETAVAGTNVGSPLVAEDDDDDDVLTYTLADDSDKFTINRATGQISVAKGAKFNHEDDDPIDGVEKPADYTVVVIATDPQGVPTDNEDNAASDASGTVTVVITVTPVDEEPLFTAGATKVAFDEVTGNEMDGLGAAYAANDPEDDVGGPTPTLGIRGADSGKFNFEAINGELKFKDKPDYEMPGDADKDNVYEVTITATDTTDNIGTKDVKVTVTNEEEGGTVTLSQPRPRVGLEIAASYDDPDGGEAGSSWEWWRSTANNLDNAPDIPENTATALPEDWEKIEDENSATYIPVHDSKNEAESDVGRYLAAVVRYTDAKENMDEETKDIARAASADPVARDTRNRAPVFVDQDGDTPGVQNETTTRKVAENTKAIASDDAAVDVEAADNVGKPVMAEDPDPNTDPLIYTLGGDDAAKFRVRDNGQIEVGVGTMLDYETKTTYMVTVMAADSFSDSSSIVVTIMVTDTDEVPDVSGDDTIEYAEKGTGMVATYNAVDPEGTATEWDVSGADADLFGIEGGVLTFKESPNFEDKKDEEGMDTSTPEAVASDNVYEVMVEATDANGQVGKKHIKVEVTNVDEAGTVKLSALQPAPGVAFTATLTDIDSSSMDLTSSATWQWAKSQSNSGGWTNIDKATGNTYTPDVDGKDSGYYLRATAKYTDGQSPRGAEEDKTAYMVSANKVLVLRVSNEAPEFAADQDPDADGPQAEAPRKVAETAVAGTNVGSPLVAEDDDDDDVLTYTLADDSDKFTINRATGQISVAKGAKFNHEDDDPIDGVEKPADYTVVVIATDPQGVPTDNEDNAASDASGTVTVVITVTPVDEEPLFTAGATKVAFDEVTGNEMDGLGAAYAANDPEDDVGGPTPTLGIRGADSGKFNFEAINGELKFKDKPDYEMPGDADKDNVYEVTITATDTTDNIGTKDVKVTVTNEEEGGTVTLSQPRPRVGLEIAASYDDPDGGEAGSSWEWWRSTANNLDNAPDIPENTATALPEDWEKIEDENSATYIPVHDSKNEAESDVGRYLAAVVRYTDAKENMDEETKDIARAASANPVARDTRNRAPVFVDQDGDTPGVQNETTTRKVAENTKAIASDDAAVDVEAADNVGKPVMAEDPDPNTDPLIYTLGGDDAAKFRVRDNGQIEVGVGTMLDYETKTTYMVTVMAADSFSDSSSIVVTIMVTDTDEVPEIMRAPDANVAPEFASATTSRTVAENTAAGEDIGNPVAANDANGDALTYALSGTDAASFDIDPDTGQLMTKVALDFETNATYSVTVTASDPGGLSDSIDVTITVTDVDEDVPAPADPLLVEYDPDSDGVIEKADMRRAVGNFFGPDPTLSREEMRRLVGIYFSISS